MSDHDDRLPMLQMLEIAQQGLEVVGSRTRNSIHTDRLLQLALCHVILITGEAATRVSDAGRARHPDVPWAKAIAARNFIAHGYDRIDYDVVWDTIADHFPSLITALDQALASYPS